MAESGRITDLSDGEIESRATHSFLANVCRLLRYLYSSPECDTSGYFCCRWFWIGVVPGSVLIHLVSYRNIVVTRLALPRTTGTRITLA